MNTGVSSYYFYSDLNFFGKLRLLCLRAQPAANQSIGSSKQRRCIETVEKVDKKFRLFAALTSSKARYLCPLPKPNQAKSSHDLPKK